MSDPDDFARLVTGGGIRVPRPGSQEQVLVRLRPSARRLVWSAATLVLLTGAASWCLLRLPAPWSVVAAALGVVLALLTTVLPALTWLSRRIVVTSRRVVLSSGLLVRTREEVLLARCTGVLLRRNWPQSLARCADIHLRGLPGDLAVLRDVPHPREVAAVLQDLLVRQETVPPAP